MVKKNNGKWRMCIDFTKLNNACPKDCYPLPKIDTLIDASAGHEMLSFMNGFSGATYQRLVNKKFAHLIRKTMEVYVDDKLVKSLSRADHISHLREAFEVLSHHKMMLNIAKCDFGVGSRNFLGHMVSKRGIVANPDKITHGAIMLHQGCLVLQSPDRFLIEYALKLDFPAMNNEGEYEALIAGLGLARAVRAKNLKRCGDSRLIIAQVIGEIEAKDDTMAKYLRVVKGILTQFDGWYAEHVPREENTTADALSQFASSEIENYPRSIYFQVLKTPTIHVINLIALVVVTSCWIDPIKTHLETRWLPNDAQEARKLLVRALRYSLIEGLLYKRSFVIPYLKCLRPLEAEEALKEAHEGICGQHLGGQENVICRFGIPRILVMYNGKQFDNAEFWEYSDDNSIELRFSSIAHPQENGKVEVANRIILDGLKKRFECSRNTWVDELLPILWAYRTTFKVTTEATPFMLAYGAATVVPLEITHGSP
ncbi:uncharacterized protein LOC141724898 [Apium graveolens]|uniref:uncharacterized protein LOC141724898 n=1 Tax=Apium graveolens TaxID=4045 RepID=UPI003D792433